MKETPLVALVGGCVEVKAGLGGAVLVLHVLRQGGLCWVSILSYLSPHVCICLGRYLYLLDILHAPRTGLHYTIRYTSVAS